MDLPTLVRRASRIHYAWIVAAVTFLTLLIAAGARSAPSVMILPLGNEFQWSRAKVSAVISVNICLFGLVGPFAAALYHRFGLRLSMFTAMVLVGAGYGLSTLATSYWQFVLLWGVVVGLGSGTAATVLGAAVANRWFTERRGLVMGLLTASSATGQLIFLPTFATVITAHGWRAAPLLVLGATAAILPVIWFGMRNAPSDLGLRPFGETGPPVAPAAPKQNPAREAVETLLAAMRVREFWLLAGSFFICGASTNGLIGTHLVSAAFDCGISPYQAANLVAMMGVFDLFGTTLSGWLSDRMNNRYLLFGYYGLRGLSLLFLPAALVGPSGALFLFSVFYGLDWVATVPPTVRLTADIFGRERSSVVFGWVAAFHQVGAATAAYFAGVLRTTSGTYSLAFMSAGGLCMLAAIGVLPIRRMRATVWAETIA